MNPPASRVHARARDPGPSDAGNGGVDPVEQAAMEVVLGLPFGQRFAAYLKRSGPGWLQAAITLGGGSLAGSLFLGVILGYHLMWLQPLAMVLGVVMLCAIGYVTLSTGERPFGAINRHVSPALGWAWVIGASLANIVWCLPQFSLALGAVQQNLIPSLEHSKGAPWVIGLVLLAAAAVVVWFYDSGAKGVKLFELILKAMVAVVVLSFFGVVVKLSATGALDWGRILAGFVPDFSYLFKPAPEFQAAIDATGPHAESWQRIVAGLQRDKIIAAFGTAVGINMTFLLPYSMLRKGWGKVHRELSVYDLSLGLIVPFVLATSCIVIASASQFHGRSNDVLAADGSVRPGMEKSFADAAKPFVATRFGGELAGLDKAQLEKRAAELREALPPADRTLAAMLVDRQDKHLALALRELAGEGTGRVVFGVGVIGMALSTIIILMLINGFCVTEMLGCPGNRNVHFAGTLIPGLVGLLSPLIWTGPSKAALAVPASVVGSSLLPIAYFTFLLLANSRPLLGSEALAGGRKLVLNTLMGIATAVATFGSVWAIKDKSLAVAGTEIPVGKFGVAVLVVLFIVGLAGFLSNARRAARA
jgi:Mn2+/Fe2+ NRAMP family transporter